MNWVRGPILPNFLIIWGLRVSLMAFQNCNQLRPTQPLVTEAGSKTAATGNGVIHAFGKDEDFENVN
jgi:hypothetical protein